MYAIISDLHSNLEALTAVLDRIERAKVEDIVCLGDVIGYGPDPENCIDLVRARCRFTIRGNHDDALLSDAADFNPIAREVIDGTRQMLKPGLFSSVAKRERWNFLKNLEIERREGPVLYVHGSPREPVKEYVMRTDVVFAPDKLRESFERIDQLCFVGHTHQPGVFIERFDGDRPYYEHRAPHELKDGIYVLGGEKVLCNVGSVGQPRDGDPRSCFVVVHESPDGKPTKIQFVRVEYDFRPTQQKIDAIPWINNLCATRLEIGK